MENLSNLKTVRQILAKHGFGFSKSLGQNFIVNPAVCPKMASLCPLNSETGALEIGAGIGVLTNELAKRAKKVVAVELDRRLMPILAETLSDCKNVKIINGDVLKLDLKQIIAENFPSMKVAVCANLPYYITSPVIMRFMEERLPVSSLTVMVQKEAAKRICAPMGSRECGALTAAVNFYGAPKLLFGVSAGSFYPAPKVDSAVINIEISPSPRVEVYSEQSFFRTVKAAFAQRRKTLANSLSAALPLEKADAVSLLNSCGIAPSARAEQLSLEQFALLANALDGSGRLKSL